GGGGDADQVAVCGAFRNGVGGIVAVGRLRRGDVGDVDGEGLGGEGAAGVSGLDGDVVAGRGLVIEQRGIGDGDDAGRGVDGEASAGIVGQGEGDGAAIDVCGGGGDADQVAVCGAFRNGVGGIVAVGRLRGGDVGEVDGEGLRTGQGSVRSLNGNAVAVAWCALVVN